MTRRFWAWAMLLALLLTAGSASIIFNKLTEPQPQPVALVEVPPSEAPAMTSPAPIASSTDTAQALLPSTTAAATEEVDPAATGRRNVLFQLARPSAMSVEIVGDFNNWLRKPMTKRGKRWEVSIPLKPGKYEYAFVIDGKRVRDPNNKLTTANGKASILTVKPLAKNN